MGLARAAAAARALVAPLILRAPLPRPAGDGRDAPGSTIYADETRQNDLSLGDWTSRAIRACM